ncbi:MAG: TetR family transcriptional regulator [Ilumatobacteraceae bacterium]|nr:TetR family transcriptional regulator [Ilumatobacteraceae bacterium]
MGLLSRYHTVSTGQQFHHYDVLMGRWEPNSRERLVVAAVDLFSEQGYDETTVAQIANRAGVTKSTFFRHFSDKRELLVAGQATLSRLFADGIASAPADAGPLDAIAAGLTRASEALGPANHELAPRLEAVIASSAELQERSILKSVGLATAMSEALVTRGVQEAIARLAAEMGVLAFHQGFLQWSSGPESDSAELARLALASLQDLRIAAASLT